VPIGPAPQGRQDHPLLLPLGGSAAAAGSTFRAPGGSAMFTQLPSTRTTGGGTAKGTTWQAWRCGSKASTTRLYAVSEWFWSNMLPSIAPRPRPACRLG